MKKYTAEQSQWLKDNATAKVWENSRAFADAFNEKFDDNRTISSIMSHTQKNGIRLSCENRLSREQKEWIKKNARIIEWKNTKHFTDTFNALFDTNKSQAAMNTYLNRNNIQIRSRKTTPHYTEKMEQWLVKNFDKYECDFVKMADDFNAKFKTDYSNCRLAKYCERKLKIHNPSKKQKNAVSIKKKEKPYSNKGQFKTGKSNNRGLPVGTIRYNSDGRPYIKVLENDGKSGKLSKRKGHNYKEPYWKPLQKKIWEDHYGEVPEGYVVVSLNGNQDDTDVKNIGIIDKRGTTVMAKKGWWTDNSIITGTGAEWCNLYYTAKDNGVL